MKDLESLDAAFVIDTFLFLLIGIHLTTGH
jgi:hypothetical protein